MNYTPINLYYKCHRPCYGTLGTGFHYYNIFKGLLALAKCHKCKKFINLAVEATPIKL